MATQQQPLLVPPLATTSAAPPPLFRQLPSFHLSAHVKDFLNIITAWFLALSMPCLPSMLVFYLFLAYGYGAFCGSMMGLVAEIVVVILCLSTLSLDCIRWVIHYIRQGKLTNMLAGMCLYAFNRIVVNGQPDTAIWLTCFLVSVMSFLILFSSKEDLRFVLESITVSCGCAVIASAVMGHHPSQASSALGVAVFSEFVRVLGADPEVFRGCLERSKERAGHLFRKPANWVPEESQNINPYKMNMKFYGTFLDV